MISKIYHLADIHCRNLKRHREYRTVFDRIYSFIEADKDEHSVIVLAGDIVHSKTEMSPELIDIVGEFFTRMASLCPTYVFLGNHDCNLNNLYRQDALTPIVENLKLPNLKLLKYSEVVVHDEVAFSHFSILEDKDKWITADQIEAKYKIALYHGPVTNASTELGYNVTVGKVGVADFDGFDIALLGDIHKRQQLQIYNKRKKHAAVEYPGSILQQNHAEELDKGFLVWNLKERTSTYISIPNDHAYFTLYAKDNKLQNKVPSHIKELTLRVKYENCDKVYLQQLQARYKLKYGLGEISLQPQSKVQIQALNHSIEDLCNVRDIEKQNSLIADFIKNLPGEDASSLDISIIQDINREINGILNSQKSPVRNVIWKPLKFTFSNMFSYGPNNEIDFTNYSGVYGVFAPNASGKSTLLDAFMYCIFDKCSKTTRALHVLNSKSKDFKSCLQFELGGKIYEIERNGRRGYNKLVPVTVNFSQIEDDGTKISLNGEDRDDTNKNIRELVGSYEDFTMTSLSTQNDNQNFIDKSQKDRKELLYKFLDIDIFEDLNKIGREFHRDLQSQIKYLEKKGLADKLSLLMSDLEKAKIQSKLAEGEVNENQKALSKIEKNLEQLRGKLIPLTESINLKEEQTMLGSKEREFEDIVKQARSHKESIASLDQQLASVDVEGLDSDHPTLTRTLSRLEVALRETSTQIAHYLAERNHLLADLKDSKDHKYDPNCAFCVASSVVSRGEAAAERLPLLEASLEEAKGLESVIQREKGEVIGWIQKLDTIADLIREKQLHESKMASLKVVAEHCKNQIEAIQARILQYEKNQASITKNASLELKIQEQITSREEIAKKNRNAVSHWNNLTKGVGVLEHSIEEVRSSLQELHNLNKKALAYSYYLQAVNRDGIPYGILNQVLPLLESEVNDILTQLVDFTITLECTDNNSITAYISYGPDRFWPVELASGMERFMLSLALRSALVNITTLPRPNFLAIDEGFGVLDADKVGSIYMLFDYLKTQYTFLICISHLDVMRDLTDKHISIVKQDGASKILG